MVPIAVESQEKAEQALGGGGGGARVVLGLWGLGAPGCGHGESSMRALCLPSGLCDIRACFPLVPMV